MTTIDYTAEAALYLGRDWQTARQHGARRFSSAAKAIRFALEEAAPVSLRGARMIVKGQKFSPADIRSLYDGSAFPLKRKREIEALIIEPAES